MAELRGAAELAAMKLAESLDPEGIVTTGLRSMIAGGLSLVPFVGSATNEALAAYRDLQWKKEFALFSERVALLEDQLGRNQSAREYLETDSGREHAFRIFSALERRNGKDHRDALAAAYVSGVGFGRFEPNVVLILDDAVSRLNGYHVQVLRWCYERQASLDLPERMLRDIGLNSLIASTGCPGAIVQKIVADLAEIYAVLDTGINRIGGYWGILHFSLTSFGITLANYVHDPRIFCGNEPPILESPVPLPR